jgi:branched-chain amino acid transport system permease protein
MVLAYLDQEGLAKIGTAVGISDVPKYNFGIYGAIIVLMMLFRPTGLIAERRHKRELEEGVHDESLYGATHSG